MSDVLRRIISSQNKEDSPFSMESDGKIMELTADQGEIFTGYYQADDGTYYSEKDWLEYQRQLELEKLAEEEYQAEQQRLAAEREARSIKTKALIAIKKRKHNLEQKVHSTAEALSPKSSSTQKPILYGSVFLIITVMGLSWIFWPESSEPQENNSEVAIADTVTSKPINHRFGNAIITGSDVRMRAEPNLKGKIVTYFPNEGERVTVLQAANDSLNWAEVERENGTKGWVYSQYVRSDSPK